MNKPKPRTKATVEHLQFDDPYNVFDPKGELLDLFITELEMGEEIEKLAKKRNEIRAEAATWLDAALIDIRTSLDDETKKLEAALVEAYGEKV